MFIFAPKCRFYNLIRINMNELDEKFDHLLDNDGDQTDDFGGEAQEAQFRFDNEDDLLHSNEGDDSDKDEEQEEELEFDDPVYQFLRERGVTDPSKIKFTNEDETEEEVDFNDLSKEEKLDILRSISDPGLSDDEIATINYLRRNGATLNDVVDYFSNQRLQAYIDSAIPVAPQRVYEIDDYTDEELFVTDLKSRYPDLTDEEILSELETAKENEETFSKKADIIRKSYKDQEDQEIAQQEAMRNQQMEDFRSNLMNAVGSFNEIQLDYSDPKSDSLTIEDDDKRKIMSYVLDQDVNGESQFVKDLRDPDRIIELAWFSTQGAQVLSDLTQYWKGLLAEQRAETKKLQAQLDKYNKTNTVIRSNKKENESDNTVTSIWSRTDYI